MATEADKLRADVERIQRELIAARKALSTLHEREAGVWIGAVVIDRNGKEHRVCTIRTAFSRPWVEGNPRLEDGRFGVAVRHLYESWTLAPDQTPPWDDKAIELAEASR